MRGRIKDGTMDPNIEGWKDEMKDGICGRKTGSINEKNEDGRKDKWIEVMNDGWMD